MKDFFKKYRYIWMLMASGLLMGVCLIVPKLGFLQWIALVPGAIALLNSAKDRDMKLKKLYAYGLLYFMCFYVINYHWFFYMYPLEFTGIGKGGALAVVLVADLGLSLFQAVGSALIFPIVGWLVRIEYTKTHPIFIPFLTASAWTAFEWAQTIGWWGVPWGRLSLGQIENVLLVRSSALFGSYFVTFTVVAVNFAVACLMKEGSLRRKFSILTISLFCLNLGLGLAVTFSYGEEGESVRVAALQGNISSTEKWDSSSRDKLLRIYRELTEAAVAEGAELVLLPETAFPYHVLESETLSDYLSELAKDNQVTVLVSAFTTAPDGENAMNSLIQFKPDGSVGSEIYSKQCLVPFGEFVPMRELVMFLIPPLANIGMLDDDLLPGMESTVLETEIGKIGCGICFDSIYETLTREAVQNGAELIVISTNDSWFSDSAALAMHNSQSRLRAIETGRYLLRSANTGISSVIDPLGNVKESIGANKTGYVVSDIYMRSNRTVYSYIGNGFVYLCILIVIGYGIVFNAICRKPDINNITK